MSRSLPLTFQGAVVGVLTTPHSVLDGPSTLVLLSSLLSTFIADH